MSHICNPIGNMKIGKWEQIFIAYDGDQNYGCEKCKTTWAVTQYIQK
jgi:hypothetical protein